MSVEDNKAAVRRFYQEVINGRNPDALDELLVPDGVDHTFGSQSTEQAKPGLDQIGPRVGALFSLERQHQRGDIRGFVHGRARVSGISGRQTGRGGLEVTDRSRHLLEIQHRDGGSAVRAHRIFGEIDRGAAVRAVDGLNVLSQFVELLRRQRTDEIFLTQEIDKCHQAAVAGIASPVPERGGALDIMREEQASLASRTAEGAGQRRGCGTRLFADDPEDLQRRRRRHLQVFVSIEPDGAARLAQIDVEPGA